jgi:site-specific DNA-methyltransferase (adenine-specific)
MARLPDASVDMILCDLPYGTTDCAWDVVIPFIPLWKEYERVIKPNGAIVLFASQPFTSLLTCSNLKLYRDRWVWVKNKATGHLQSGRKKPKMPLNACEDILVFYKKQPVFNPQITTGHIPTNASKHLGNTQVFRTSGGTETKGGDTDRMPMDVLYFPVVNNDDPERIHPTQKPVALLRYLIRTYTHPGAVVLDNAAGSGATAVACIEEQRHFICFEDKPAIYTKANRRIKRAKAQLQLFPQLRTTRPPVRQPEPAQIALEI